MTTQISRTAVSVLALAAALGLASCTTENVAAATDAGKITTVFTAPPAEARPAPAPQAAEAAPAKSALVQQLSAMKLDIPYTKYVLKNGLTLLVNEDHKTPTVYFNIWYHVASKNEPERRTGFAHLFEHIMYQGSQHWDDDFFKATQKIGASNQNGSTSSDRTNYYQSVPKESLESILWLESDRMGFLLPTLTKAKLDEQRGVVQNEKRQGDNQPYGLVQYRISDAIYPKGHPYAHSVIGSMDDLDAASLEDVKDWFRTWYGPSNAVVVLSGDITAEEAKAKVEKYFGEIPSGPPVAHPKAWVAKRSGAQREEMFDRVASPRIYKVWNVPEFNHPEGELLDVAAYALGGDKNARLTKRLVHDEQVATSVGVGNGQSEIAGRFQITVTAKPDADLAHIEQVIDEEMAKFFQTGPTAAELEKVQVQNIAGIVSQTERTSSKAQLLATWETFTGDAAGWKTSLKRIEDATPQAVAASARKWLSDGSYTLVVKPFGNPTTGAGAERKAMGLPAAGDVAAVNFPAFKKATLSNGMKLLLAERHDTPQVSVSLSVDSGYATDFASTKEGVAALTGNLLDEGTASRTGLQIAEELDRLGASLSTFGGGETSSVSFSALTPTVDQVMGIWADVLRNPSFTDADFKRLQGQQLQATRQAQLEPNAISNRVMNKVMWGDNHPYGRSATPETVASITKADVADFYKRWYGPNNATIVVVGDTTLEAITPKLEAALRGWGNAPGKRAEVAVVKRPAKSQVYIIDRPGAVQTVITVATPQGKRDYREDQKYAAFNSLFGGAFTSRINMNLREDKGWSYGARTTVSAGLNQRVFSLNAPVQTDATKGALGEIRKELTNVVGSKPVSQAELDIATNSAILGMGTRWEAADAVGGSLESMLEYGLPDDYWYKVASNYKALTVADMTSAAKTLVPDQNHIWVVVGDRAKIEKDVRALNLGEVHIVDANGNPVS
ncbi:MAG TPA: pitrilysin family protein [Hyphomonadaceae bacterium]|nr:pitrilysin family protein [Hyphomonadaceae bacterium]